MKESVQYFGLALCLVGALATIAADHFWANQGLSTAGLIVMLGGFALYVVCRWMGRGR